MTTSGVMLVAEINRRRISVSLEESTLNAEAIFGAELVGGVFSTTKAISSASIWTLVSVFYQVREDFFLGQKNIPVTAPGSKGYR